MKKSAREQRLAAMGWRTGTAKEFLHLSDEEAAYVEIKHQLAKALRAERKKQKLTQASLAKVLKSSQARVARMEAGDRSVSIDLLVRSHLRLGTALPALVRAVRASA